jgi:hypothetical protein
MKNTGMAFLFIDKLTTLFFDLLEEDWIQRDVRYLNDQIYSSLKILI